MSFDDGRPPDREESPPIPDPASYEHTRDIPAHVRRAVLRRDNYRCRRCGRDENLTLHHVVPRSRTHLGGGVHTEANLVTVCWQPCHALIERREVIVKKVKHDWYFSDHV